MAIRAQIHRHAIREEDDKAAVDPAAMRTATQAQSRYRANREEGGNTLAKLPPTMTAAREARCCTTREGHARTLAV
ncbi:hypothetical protein GUJ93_ZPchr0004g38296 [Zizania palustris]|uniref:Uncharacterized protein n=1 Tax=Zizania palustris TaxID=103762 RepID=A0A8J5VFL0_ZIZPA|nr:hypothetical protein GUJ93_ZPchr0004g38296 [Zizania palustris]